MADWRRRSIAGGPSPSGALHLDFFYRPSAARIPFPCDGADGDSKMAVASPATTNEASPLQPRQRQPIGTAATGGGGSGSRRQLSFDDDHVVVFLDYDEAGEEKKMEVSLLCDEVLDEEDDEDEDGADDEEEEEDDEEEEEPQVMCLDCGIVVASLILVPCWHVCYCADCYCKAGWLNGSLAGVPCPVCGQISERAHPL